MHPVLGPRFANLLGHGSTLVRHACHDFYNLPTSIGHGHDGGRHASHRGCHDRLITFITTGPDLQCSTVPYSHLLRGRLQGGSKPKAAQPLRMEGQVG